MAPQVAGDLYVGIDGQLREIKRQLRQKGGYPYDPMKLVGHLQAAIEGNLVNLHGQPFSKSKKALLEPLGTITMAPRLEFVAGDHFVINTDPKVPATISFLGSNFREWFLGKIEEPAAETMLRYAKLIRSEFDGPIMAELGDHKETTLAQIFALMERQLNGEEGVLLTNGLVNIFYVHDVNGVLRAVDVYWSGVGWLVFAVSVSDSRRWHDGLRVFSRNF